MTFCFGNGTADEGLFLEVIDAEHGKRDSDRYDLALARGQVDFGKALQLLGRAEDSRAFFLQVKLDDIGSGNLSGVFHLEAEKKRIPVSSERPTFLRVSEERCSPFDSKLFL